MKTKIKNNRVSIYIKDETAAYLNTTKAPTLSGEINRVILNYRDLVAEAREEVEAMLEPGDMEKIQEAISGEGAEHIASHRLWAEIAVIDAELGFYIREWSRLHVVILYDIARAAMQEREQEAS